MIGQNLEAGNLSAAEQRRGGRESGSSKFHRKWGVIMLKTWMRTVLFSLLICLLTAGPVCVKAAEDDEEEEGYEEDLSEEVEEIPDTDEEGSCGAGTTYTLKNGTLTIGGTGAIQAGAFRDRDDILTIVIGEGVTSVGEKAFYNIWTVTSVQIGPDVTVIGKNAFQSCPELATLTFDSGSQLKTIEAGAFASCRHMTAASIPDTVTTIGDEAFTSCYRLKTLVLPASLTSIGERAFYGCRLLKNFTMPASLTSIGNAAFQQCETLTSVTIPAGVTEIGDETFRSCDQIRTVTLPASLTRIGTGAFRQCCSLTKITIPAGVTEIGEKAFWGCTQMTSVTLPSSLTMIRAKAFADCTALTKVTYTGSETKWDKVGMESGNQYLTDAKFTFQGGVRTLKTPTVRSITSPSSGALSVKWKKRVRADGYQIEYSRYQTFSTYKKKTIRDQTVRTKKITGLTKGKYYYVRIRAYRKLYGRTYYSAWSTAVKLKITK